MTADPWIHMLKQLEPEYDKYKDITEYGQSKFMVSVTRDIKGKFQILIYDDWNLDSKEFDVSIFWSTEQLASWPNCRRIAFDRWQFKRRGDAEKFKTLFILKWAR
jgi:hypothetical protein